MYACIHIPKAEPPAHGALVAMAAMFSPQVEAAGQGTVIVSIDGLRRLMGGPRQIASEMARRGAERGLLGNIAIAANPDTAVLAALHLRGVTLIPPGGERECLGPLRISALPIEQETAEVLERWGIRTLEEFCALPESGVLERLGPQGLALLKLARGQRTRPLRAQAEAACYDERIALDHPVALLEPLLFLVSRLLSGLCGRLKSQSMAAGEIRLALELEDKSEHTRILQLPFATCDAKALLKLLQLDLEAHPARDAVVAMRVSLKPVEPRIVQHGLYAPPAPEPERLELTLGKIRALVGEGNTGSPELIDTHRPDAWRMRPTPPGAQTLVYEEKPEPALRMGFRYFRPPRPARVDLRGAAPSCVTAAAVQGRVREASGPWHGSGGWWSTERWVREEWDVELEDGALYRLYAASGRWFVEGELRLMFVELHARSAFSFLAGASAPEDLLESAARLGMDSIALVDIDNVSGAPRFFVEAKKQGIRAHVGAEVTAAAGGRYVLLAENRTGYQNLCRLISSMKLRSEKGKAAATEDEFRRFSAGLICLTRGGQSIETLLGVYGRRNVYCELQRHFDRQEEARNHQVRDMAARHCLPLLASNGVLYARPDNRELYDVLTCIRHKTRIAEAGRLLSKNSERYLKSDAEMRRLFSDIPEALAGTMDLARRLDFTLANLGYRFPPYPAPEGDTQNSFLRKRVDEGARSRFLPFHDKARAQVERELKLIEKLDLAGYFLIVWDIVRFCAQNGILAQGRGSAANSAVCYALGITAVDPIALDLLFERFLSEERGEWPDIDIDLPSGDQRERVIQYVYQRYGRFGAAMTANVITYRGRSGVRDIGKVLGFGGEELDRMASVVSRWGWQDPEEKAEEQFARAQCDVKDPRFLKFIELFKQIQHLPRHLGQHSGGMVICQGSLDSVVPLEPATMPGRVVIQWDKEDCADLGLIKVDLLGLGMMAVLEETVDLVREAYGEDVDLAHLPQDDPKVYEALQQADTVGLFQVESRAQMASLPLTRPRKFYDLVVQVAIIRPGPIVGKMYHPYVRRRQGLEPPVSLHPSLDVVLKRTLGVPLFQEQLLRMAMIAASFTGGEAEELRRAMGFQRSPKRMRAIEERLRTGMQANGITGETQDKIIQSITSFALYGFPESHAASFALLAYASAYLRTAYPAAFTAALLNNQPMGFYHPSTIVKDAQRHGLRVLPVDVTKSLWKAGVENRCLRLGLNYVRGLREPVGQRIVEERQRQPFSSISNFKQRLLEVHKDEMRQLAGIGALNFIGDEKSHRREALWRSELALKPAGPLFEALEPNTEESPLEPMNAFERTAADFRGTGVTIGAHPVALHRKHLDSLGVIRAADLRAIRHNARVRIAGCVICRQRPETAKGFAFYSLEDETGISNAIVEPKLFEANKLLMVREPYLLFEGILQNQGGAASVKVLRAEPLRFGPELIESHDFC